MLITCITHSTKTFQVISKPFPITRCSCEPIMLFESISSCTLCVSKDITVTNTRSSCSRASDLVCWGRWKRGRRYRMCQENIPDPEGQQHRCNCIVAHGCTQACSSKHVYDKQSWFQILKVNNIAVIAFKHMLAKKLACAHNKWQAVKCRHDACTCHLLLPRAVRQTNLCMSRPWLTVKSLPGCWNPEPR